MTSLYEMHKLYHIGESQYNTYSLWFFTGNEHVKHSIMPNYICA
jgi:hypothetical protein